MIDFHSHIIPNIDDGAENIATTLEMLKISYGEGTSCICATPHFIPEEMEISRSSYDILFKEVVYKKSANIKIITGLELYMSPSIPNLWDKKKIWGINDTNYLIIELPLNSYPNYADDVFYELSIRGVKPIIAHPERNIYLQNNLSKMKDLLGKDILFQVNSGSLTGKFGEDAKNTAHDLVKRNMVHLLGSDAHGSDSRTPKIRKAFDLIKDMNLELYNWILSNEENIINGKPVLPLPIKEEEKKKTIFSFLKKKRK
ncbi:tyrosine-protein phosphatase [Clostridium cellulovorans]|uniref:protein-tyrosine-phosphatase n=1 Tax=Clostridium cellulovorans (strain ATCC 35296 / DSM 3052 / OCM 3 / 743B) TaxID=573061 RepID=D9SR40_CLOC7|nr:CpsB/CapC family capsule biosynthesis tyrosine phosphatase [Clostridium cellulovorans]ADL50328.1 Protein-tyrosine-phosphatase [Clostridium cellulovorans 743B]